MFKTYGYKWDKTCVDSTASLPKATAIEPYYWAH